VPIKYCRVAVNYPRNTGLLTYSYSDLEVDAGFLVEVPLGKRKAKGCIVESNLVATQLSKNEKKYEIKDIVNLILPEFTLTKRQMSLYTWISKYYHFSLGKIIFDSFPKILIRPKEHIIESGHGSSQEIILNNDQKKITDNILKRTNKFDKFYIHGVTGSGKTICYLEIIKSVIKANKSILFLLPEINLTPQFTKTLLESFTVPIFSYHSSITNSEKFNLWKYLTKNESACIVIGVRSSVFLPFNNLGLIIVDEEHDNSFKQTDRCPYNARDVAIKKAQLSECPVIMGSATPMSEQYFHFKNLNEKVSESGKVSQNYFQLKKRALGYFPEVNVIDEVSDKNRELWPLTNKAIEIIQDALNKNEQVLVFLNRLGFAQFVQCSNCGFRFTDPNTGVNLRYFKNKNTLESNYSDYKIPFPSECPDCGNLNMLSKGFGTEKVHEVLSKYFTENTFERFDRDKITSFEKLSHTLKLFEDEKIDVLVGTQMLSKGHNFKKVNTVLILGVDSLLNFPDFRSTERVYQTIMQVAGRAGRYSKDSKVYIQTKMTNHPILEIVKQNNLEKFYKEYELPAREMAMLPPYSKLVSLFFSMRFKDKLIEEINNVAVEFNKYISSKKLQIDVLGPTPLMVEKRANQYTWSILLRSKKINELHLLIQVFENTYKLKSGISVKIDVDPYFTL